jgi:ribosome-associated protein
LVPFTDLRDFTMDPIAFDLRGDHITLDALLKACGLATSGGDAKILIQQGGVQVNGEVDVRRGRKLRAGDEVAVGERRVSVRAAA